MKANKNEVFNHAKELVNEKGLAHLTIRDLALKADVSIGTIYNFFETKDNLILLLIDDYWHRAVTEMINSIDYDNDSIDELIEFYKRYLLISRDFHRDWISDIEGIQMSSKPVRALNQKYRDLVVNSVIKLIDKDNIETNDNYRLTQVAEVIHTISIKTNFNEEELFYREVIKRLL